MAIEFNSANFISRENIIIQLLHIHTSVHDLTKYVNTIKHKLTSSTGGNNGSSSTSTNSASSTLRAGDLRRHSCS